MWWVMMILVKLDNLDLHTHAQWKEFEFHTRQDVRMGVRCLIILEQ